MLDVRLKKKIRGEQTDNEEEKETGGGWRK